MPQDLEDLRVSEISLVDFGANADTDPVTGERIRRARFALLKRDQSQVPTSFEQEELDAPAIHKQGATMPLTLEEIEKQLGDQAKVNTAQAALIEKLEAENALTPDERAFYSKLDAEKRPEFLKCDTAKKKATMAEAEPDGDEEDDKKKAMKKLDDTSQELATTKARVAKVESEYAATKTELADVMKRERTARFVNIAKNELSHTSGTDEAKAETLMKMADALGEESEAYKQTFGAMTKADEVLASMFVEKGTWGGNSGGDSMSQLEARGSEIAKRDGCSKEQGFVKAAEENPKLYATYQEEFRSRHRV